ncbi:MAG: hypothetical protein CSA81_14075 [Acidobacteria bacterium]|nr:MAG: hypothetical protein CSA81_14075 [Acidobacteriota bacterium]
MNNIFSGNKNKAGFTLVELLLVIAIIGILASVIFLNMGSMRQRAKAVAALENQKGVMGIAVDCYLHNKNITPPGSGSLGGGSICEDGTTPWPEIDRSCQYAGGTVNGWTVDCSEGRYVINCDATTGGCKCEGC